MSQRTLPGAGPPVLSVADVNRRVKDDLEGDPRLSDILVKGEVSNLRPYPSGTYFSLKDDSGELRCVIWREHARSLPPEIRDGTAVVARGHVSVYLKRGEYQLTVSSMQPEGAGLLWLRLQELKAKLEAEGLFSPARKRPLPALPARVGIVTSRSGAVLHDIVTVLERRSPYLEVVFADARVQGAEAAASVAAAIARLGRPGSVDVLIVARGGGSIEDLWGFNEEAVVRAVAACPVPVISAVGHETDWTLCDLAADWRAPTPSAAAERVAPGRDELLQRLAHGERRMATRLQGRLELARSRLQGLETRPVFTRPDAILASPRQRLDEATMGLPRGIQRVLERTAARLQQHAGVLDALSPLKTLARGFAVATVDGATVRRVQQAPAGTRLDVRVTDGVIETTVTTARRTRP